ncbi:MAG: hypothetical protein GEU26_17955 [Nitrososphaeraceae archaeon]|nr:hypothetical protein [Nitrososphaeraceae archaeon]
MNNSSTKKKFYRSRTEIIADILTAVADNEPRGVGKTRIMFLSQLSFDPLTDYLEDLLTNGLLIYKDRKELDNTNRSVKGTYHITAKGSEYFALYNLMNTEDISGLRPKEK